MSEQIDHPSTGETETYSGQEMNLPSVGALLRQAREARGLEVGDIAQALKLGPRQVESLELDAWSDLPGTTFIRGFVRNYARLLGIDAAPLMAQLESRLDRPADTLNVPEATPARIRSGGRSRDKLVIAVGGLLLLLAALAYFLLPSDLSGWRAGVQSLLDGNAAEDTQAEVVVPLGAPAGEPLFPPADAAGEGDASRSDVAPASAPVAVPLAVPAPTPAEAAKVTPETAQAMESKEKSELPAPAVTEAEPPSAGEVVRQAASGSILRFHLAQESWLEVRDRDDMVVFSQRLPGGSEKAVDGRPPLSVTIGYAPGVTLIARGKVIDLAPHTRGDVARVVVE